MSRVIKTILTLTGLMFSAQPTLMSGAQAQTEMELRNTNVVQSVYLRTLSLSPSAALVKDAETAFDLAMRSYGATDGRTADMAVNLGRALNGTEQYQAAVPLLESALSIYAEYGDSAHLRAAVGRYELGVAHLGAGDNTAAVEALTKAFADLEPTFRRLSADTGFIRDALRSAGGQDAIRAAEREAANASPVTSTQPKPTLRLPPIYPPDESLASVDGWVLLDYRLWPGGGVRDVFVLAAAPAIVFDISAAMALMQWRFEPQSDSSAHYQLNVAFNAQ